MFKTKDRGGYTALEILISVGIIAILAFMVSTAFSGFRDSRIMEEASQGVVDALRETRSRTLASEKGKQFGVHFESSRLVIFSGQNFDENDPENEARNIPREVEIFNINFSGPDIVFKRLTGEASPEGNVSLRLKKDLSETRAIYINSAGLIYE